MSDFEQRRRRRLLMELGEACGRAGRRGSRTHPGTLWLNDHRFPLPPANSGYSRVPIIGRIPAGLPERQNHEELGSLPVDLEALNIKKSSRVFALRVKGDSMIGANISDGDLVVIDAREPRPGDIVAALIDGETTLKRFVARDGEVYLKAENPAYPDLIPLNELIVQGVVRAVVRVCDSGSDA